MWKGPYLDAMLVGLPPYSVCVGGFDITDAVEPARRRQMARCRPGRTIHLDVARRQYQNRHEMSDAGQLLTVAPATKRSSCTNCPLGR